jgi:hypothetical protein
MLSHTHFVKPVLLGVLALAVLPLVSGCDNSSSSKPPPSATNTGGGGNGNPINHLAESPTSLYGKSAARGRDVARDASNYQDEAAGIAGESTGETQPLTVQGLVWSVPTAWTKRTSSSSMVVAEYVVGPNSGNGEAVVKYFGNIGGGVDANIERWRTQVLNPEGAAVEETNTKHRTVAGVKVTTVAMEGTLKASEMGGPSKNMPNSSFRAAIFEGPSGTVFIKFTGPADVVAQNEAAWNSMVFGMHKP